MFKQKIILLLIISTLTVSVFGQRETTLNLPKFEHRFMHFGFLLGLNAADFRLDRYSTNVYGADTLMVLEPLSTTGFNLGIVSEMHLGEYFGLRFTPNLAFSQRKLVYTFMTFEGEKQYTKDIESTLINFPLNLKIKSQRLNNFSAYIIGGASYSLDLASNEGAQNLSTNLNDIFIKLGKHDFMGEIGVGTDFYLEYFKFGLELKMSYGLRDIHIREDNAFSNPIDKLKTKMFLLSFTFEG
jgi:hypothetical protein